jgi:hypothetical protein
MTGNQAITIIIQKGALSPTTAKYNEYITKAIMANKVYTASAFIVTPYYNLVLIFMLIIAFLRLSIALNSISKVSPMPNSVNYYHRPKNFIDYQI